MPMRSKIAQKLSKSKSTNDAKDAEQASPNDPTSGLLTDATTQITDAGSKSITGDKADRATAFIDSVQAGEIKGPVLQALKCFLMYGVKPLIVVIMAYVWVGKKIYAIYQVLPMNIVQMILGLLLCFFGGTYCYTIAALEAFRNFGGMALLDELSYIWDEAQRAAKASEEDDKVDKNDDKIPDVQQMSTNELITHKAWVAMVAIEDPMRFHNAIQYLMSAWLAVLATLKFQFAKTVAIAFGIVDMVSLPITRILGPFLTMMVGDDLKKWVPTMIRITCQLIGVIIAGIIQKMICCYYSALRGGSMFAEAFISILGERGLLDKLPASIVTQPFDANLSYLDECIGYPLAIAGGYWQFTQAFQVPFPWSIPMFPMTMAEYYIMFAVNT